MVGISLSVTYKLQNWLTKSSLWVVCCIHLAACSQSLRYVSAPIISLVNKVLRSSIILPVMLSIDFEKSTNTGTIKISHTDCKSTVTLDWRIFHHCKMSNSSRLESRTQKSKVSLKLIVLQSCYWCWTWI